MAPKRKAAAETTPAAPAVVPAAPAVPAPAAADAEPTVEPNMMMAALEAGGVQAFLVFTSQALAQVLGAALHGAQWGNAYLGVVRLVLAVGLFAGVYGQRFRPNAEPSEAGWAAARGLLSALVPRVDATLLLVLLFHVAQLAVMTSSTVLPGGPPAASAATACFAATPLLWGVLWEELVYRGIVFYIVLQRSGGRVRFTALVTAVVFGAVHIGAIVKQRADTPLVLVQCAGAVLFGVTYSLLFAASGSLGNTVLAHAANNAVALVWMAVDPSAPAGSPACAPRFSTALAGSVGAQAVVYLAAAGLAYRALAGRLATPAGAGGASNAFREAHPVVFGGAGGGEAKAKAD